MLISCLLHNFIIFDCNFFFIKYTRLIIFYLVSIWVGRRNASDIQKGYLKRDLRITDCVAKIKTHRLELIKCDKAANDNWYKDN